MLRPLGALRVAVWPVVVGAVGVRCGGWAIGALVSVGAVLAPSWRRRLASRRQSAAYDDQLVGLLRATAAGLRSGAVLRVALAGVEPGRPTSGLLGRDLQQLIADLDGGVVPALEAWTVRRPRPSVRLVAGGMALGHATGGVTAASVDALADTIRLRLDGRDEAAALATQANLSALLLAGAPLAFLLGGFLTHSGSSAFLLGEPAGRLCLVGGLLLDAGALWVMVRLARAVAP